MWAATPGKVTSRFLEKESTALTLGREKTHHCGSFHVSAYFWGSFWAFFLLRLAGLCSSINLVK